MDQLCYSLDEVFVDPSWSRKEVSMGVYEGVTTVEFNESAAETAAHLSSNHPDYEILAARIVISNLHKNMEKRSRGRFNGL